MPASKSVGVFLVASTTTTTTHHHHRVATFSLRSGRPSRTADHVRLGCPRAGARSFCLGGCPQLASGPIGHGHRPSDLLLSRRGPRCPGGEKGSPKASSIASRHGGRSCSYWYRHRRREFCKAQKTRGVIRCVSAQLQTVMNVLALTARLDSMDHR